MCAGEDNLIKVNDVQARLPQVGLDLNLVKHEGDGGLGQWPGDKLDSHHFACGHVPGATTGCSKSVYEDTTMVRPAGCRLLSIKRYI
jgi:hypothetical protein